MDKYIASFPFFTSTSASLKAGLVRDVALGSDNSLIYLDKGEFISLFHYSEKHVYIPPRVKLPIDIPKLTMLRNNEIIYYNSKDRAIDIVSIDTEVTKKTKIPYKLSNPSWTGVEVFPKSDLFCLIEI